MKYLIIAWIFIMFLFAGTYEMTVIMQPPETDMEVVESGRRARDLILQGYSVYLNGQAVTLNEAMEMANY